MPTKKQLEAQLKKALALAASRTSSKRTRKLEKERLARGMCIRHPNCVAAPGKRTCAAYLTKRREEEV